MISFDSFRLNLMEIVSSAFETGEGDDPPMDYRTFSIDPSCTRLYHNTNPFAKALYAVTWIIDSLTFSNNMEKGVFEAMEKTQTAGLYFLEEVSKTNWVLRAESVEKRCFFNKFVQTFKMFLNTIDGAQGEKIERCLRKVFPSERFRIESLRKELLPAFKQGLFLEYEQKTHSRVPLNLFASLRDLTPEAKSSLKKWLMGSFVAFDWAWQTKAEREEWKQERIQDLPGLIHVIWEQVYGGLASKYYFLWCRELEAVIGDFPLEGRLEKFYPTSPLPKGYSLHKARSLFEYVHFYERVRCISAELPTVNIWPMDPFDRVWGVEELESADPLSWAPLLLNRMFQSGEMFLNPLNVSLNYEDFGMGQDGALKTRASLVKDELSFYTIDCFVWEAAGKDPETYFEIYKKSALIQTGYGLFFKYLCRHKLYNPQSAIPDLNSYKGTLKALCGIDEEFITYNIQRFEVDASRLIRHSGEKVNGFLKAWDSNSWDICPGLWWRHFDNDMPFRQWRQKFPK